jgi:predicted nucleic acid-binding protein
VLHLDTGCLLKLYHPEPNSGEVAAAVAGAELCFTALHELEITTALRLKVFRGEAVSDQADAAHAAIEQDVAAGKLVGLSCDWATALHGAQALATQYAASTGCRSLDMLHCAAAAILGLQLLFTDARQIALATAAGLSIHPLKS